MKIINCFGYDWYPEHPWGCMNNIEDRRANCWTDETAISINNGIVTLRIHRNPKSIKIYSEEWSMPITISADYGVGCMCSVQDFLFGRFTWYMLAPIGDYLWPALWMYTRDKNINAEIDAAELYSFNTGYRVLSKWCKHFRGWDIETCVHTGIKNHSIPALRVDLEDYNIDPSMRITKYELFWSPSIISFYIDDVCTRSILDQKVLDHLAAHKMMVVMNLHVDGRYYKKFDLNTVKQPMKIFKFNHVPLNTDFAGSNLFMTQS